MRSYPSVVAWRGLPPPTAALWITASYGPSALAVSAACPIPAMTDKSPTATPAASGTMARACAARPSFRACSTTRCPPAASCRAVSCPIPSDDPVMKMLAMPQTLPNLDVLDPCGLRLSSAVG